MSFIHQAIDIILHLDVHLNTWAGWMGPWLYVLLFLIIFCETGLVVTPFLPGDSLLFAVGALCAVDNAVLNIGFIIPLLILAGVIGDATNYAIGRFVGPKVFFKEDSIWFNKNHLVKAQGFYEKYGAKTIVIARYVPIIRTFAPFVAGIGKMFYPRFFAYNVIGAISWVVIFVVAGFYFGNIPSVKRNFHIVIFAIIGVSVLPILLEYCRARYKKSAV